MTRQKNKAEYRDERAADPEDEWDVRRSRTDVRRRSGNTGNHRRGRRRNRQKARIRFLASMLGTLLGAILLVLGAYTALNLFCGFGKVKTQKLREQGYPESLIALVERNPETKDFVLDYPKYKGLEEIDISKEVMKGEIPHFLQWDERWGYEIYGSDFLAVTGCGPTCLSMVTCGLTGDTQWNPYEVAKMAEDNGYYVDGSGSSWALMSSGAEKLGLTVSSVTAESVQALREMMREGVEQEIAWGHYVIGDDIPGLNRQMISDYIRYLGNLRWTSLGYPALYPGFESEPESMEWVSQYADANMVKTDFFEARSTAYAKSTALIDDL